MPDQRGADGTPDPPLNRPAGIPAARRRALFLGLAVIAVITYGADQLSKAWAVRTLTDEPPRSLVGTFLQLDLIRNPGAAFSLGTGSTWVLTLIAVVVLLVRGLRGGHGGNDPSWRRHDDPEHILAQRFARGEIDETEYRARVDTLRKGP